MARIRKVEIQHFRMIEKLSWYPAAGINCLIGPGDSGKSSILDAIDFCLGARRNIQFTDADFHKLDVDTPIVISVTLGGSSEALGSEALGSGLTYCHLDKSGTTFYQTRLSDHGVTFAFLPFSGVAKKEGLCGLRRGNGYEI